VAAGTNGAGKTTTFRLLTGAILPTSGEVYIAGRSLESCSSGTHGHIGYCPQAGGLTGVLTGREMLTFYSRIRGLPPAITPAAVTLALTQVGLNEYADMPCAQYSGGNCRKLSVAVAMIGAPRVLLLDEPTTGMDPTARRALWGHLQAARRAGHTLVLTSHLMEEADALCTRIGILVHGRLRCVGAPLDLKARLCGGYVVEARLPRERHAEFADRVRAAMPEADVSVTGESWSDIVVVSVTAEELDVPMLFEVVEREHRELEGTSYSVAQASLEHVFMRIATSTICEDGPVGQEDALQPECSATGPA
jgi:ABC-type multidrug transport system ATPase subunit